MVSEEKNCRTNNSYARDLSGLAIAVLVVFFGTVDCLLVPRIQPEGIRGPMILSMSAVLSVLLTKFHREKLLHRKSWRHAPLTVWLLLGLANSVVLGFIFFCLSDVTGWWSNREERQVWVSIWFFLMPIIIYGGLFPKPPRVRILYPKRLLYYCGVFGILSLLYLGSTLDVWQKLLLGWLFVVGIVSGIVFRGLEKRLGLKFDRVYEDEVVEGDGDV